MRRSVRTWTAGLCGLGLLLAVVVAAPARQIEITLKNGRTVSGELVNETRDAVTIRIADIETTYPRSQIKKMHVKLTLRQKYRQRRSGIDEKDDNARYKLARWLYNRGSLEGYRLALKELNGLLEGKPDHKRAKLLREVTREKIKEAKSSPSGDDQAEPSTGSSAKRGRPEPAKLLSEAEVRLIKVFEVNLNERPRVRIPRPTIEKLFQRYRNSLVLQPYRGRQGRGRFRRLKGYEQLGLLFDLQARQLYDEVRVRDEPEVLQEFRTRIHTSYLVRYCGRCHGQRGSPGFKVVTRGASSEKVAYTNYMMLRRTVAESKPLLYRPRPANSPFLQYGLPRRNAETPHPQVTNWRPYFNSAQDPRYREMVEWVGRLWGETEDYPIEFELPKSVRGADDGEGAAGSSGPGGQPSDPSNGGSGGGDGSGDGG